ncbi:MAG: zinc ribbon domain-containing protein [Acidobacteriota bacterium]|nr:zinc ribbon domain-containing protein [Acidobacteriota bacterium]
MPLYEFQCNKCAHRFERMMKFSDPQPETCPSCGGPIRQLISAPAVQFKGSGWYVTDYAHKNSAPASHSTPAAEHSSEGSTPAASSTPSAPSTSGSAPTSGDSK